MVAEWHLMTIIKGCWRLLRFGSCYTASATPLLALNTRRQLPLTTLTPLTPLTTLTPLTPLTTLIKIRWQTKNRARSILWYVRTQLLKFNAEIREQRQLKKRIER